MASGRRRSYLHSGLQKASGIIMDASAWQSLSIFVGLNFAAATSGAIFKPGAWYADLRKPAWTPPNWAFPLTWATLFCANAASGWLVWETAGSAAGPALIVYGLSLALNAGWSLLFFGLRRMDWALGDVVAFWFSIAAMIMLFAPIRPLAAWLLVPYLAWVTVAAVLNLRLLQMNQVSPATRAEVGAR